MVQPRQALSLMTVALALIGPVGLGLAQAPQVRELRTQQVGGTTYFHVRLELPADFREAKVEQLPAQELKRRLVLLPQFVPQDLKAQAVYQRLVIPDYRPSVGFDLDRRRPVPVQGLEFVGKVQDHEKVVFALIYPTKDGNWQDCRLELDFSQAARIAVPAALGKRKPPQAPLRDDLEGLWAEAQAARLAVLEVLAPEFGFYGFACEATGRKYGVQAPALDRDSRGNPELLHRRLYETTTGSAAITESLQLHRLLHPAFRDNGQRTVDIWKVPGIDIAEHPWKQMMGEAKPAPEPLATLVPHDNFYVHFKDIRKFIELGELLDQWGTNVLRAYEMNSRDYYIKDRYEKQLCLRSGWLGKTLGPAVVRGLALTGSEGYVREGSDLTVLFHVTSVPLFLAGIEPFLQEARQEFPGQLKETKAEYHGVPVESFVTPLREISLHRAVLGEFVVYSNSATALRRVLDTHQGRLKALADSLDFQYMRTIFRLDDPKEDGFAFLSDAFIRQLVGPASKIKAKRRLEALTSLTMVTHGALFTAWDSGKLPADQAALLAATALKPAEIATPEGREVTWDAARKAAVSDSYNTLHFPTPLIELAIDKITPAEEQGYLQFRTEYLNLWRKFFDPVGFRFSFSPKQMKMETFILPLIRSGEYDSVRQWTGGGTTPVHPGAFAPETLFQFLMHTNQRVADGIGEWILFRLDDDASVRQLMDHLIRKQEGPSSEGAFQNQIAMFRVALQLPLTMGLQVSDRKEFEKTLESLRNLLQTHAGPMDLERLKPTYRGVTITRLRFAADSHLANFLELKSTPPTFYHAFVDDGWYISAREAPIKAIIDRSVARREGKLPQTKETPVEVNQSLYLSPIAAKKARAALKYYLEWEAQRRSLANEPLWYPLYRSGLVAEYSSEKALRECAMRFYGYVPVSPEGAPYTYERRTDEVVNGRHGSLRRPRSHPGVEDTSPLGQLLDQFRAVRADFRFREDGVHTILTIDRNSPAR